MARLSFKDRIPDAVKRAKGIQEEALYQPAHAGRDRMPLRTSGASKYADLWVADSLPRSGARQLFPVSPRTFLSMTTQIHDHSNS